MRPMIALDGTILTPAEAELIRGFRMYSPELRAAILELTRQMVNGVPGAETVEWALSAARRQQD